MRQDSVKAALSAMAARAEVSDPTIRGATGFKIPREFFREAAKFMKAEGWRLAAEWASDSTPSNKGLFVHAAYFKDGEYIVIKANLPADDAVFPSLSKVYTAAYRFERQIESLMGLTPEGHPDLRPWIRHEDWPLDAHPLRKTFDPAVRLPRVQGEYRWIKAEGEGVYEIPVGPVHAGIIEPGHFRFQAVGEDILNLEERLGYVHKGIEKRFEQMGWIEGARLAGRVSGDSTVAHAIAYSSALEAASECEAPERALYIRALLLERERIANHLGDIGAICNDTAFTFMLYQMAILREKVLRTNKRLFGSRLTMDLVTPGGVKADVTPEGASEIIGELKRISVEFDRLIRIYEDNPSLEDRLYGAGVLAPATAKDLGVVGFVGRSSGCTCDVRLDTPVPPYDRIKPTPAFLSSGDVHARTWVRIAEVRDSIRLISEILSSMPEGPTLTEWKAPEPGVSAFSAVEGWRGEIIYWIEAGEDGGINRCMVRDPSSVNWLSLEQAIKGNIVPDFPLCNKSFNQSYSGHDL